MMRVFCLLLLLATLSAAEIPHHFEVHRSGQSQSRSFEDRRQRRRACTSTEDLSGQDNIATLVAMTGTTSPMDVHEEVLTEFAQNTPYDTTMHNNNLTEEGHSIDVPHECTVAYFQSFLATNRPCIIKEISRLLTHKQQISDHDLLKRILHCADSTLKVHFQTTLEDIAAKQAATEEKTQLLQQFYNYAKGLCDPEQDRDEIMSNMPEILQEMSNLSHRFFGVHRMVGDEDENPFAEDAECILDAPEIASLLQKRSKMQFKPRGTCEAIIIGNEKIMQTAKIKAQTENWIIDFAQAEYEQKLKRNNRGPRVRTRTIIDQTLKSKPAHNNALREFVLIRRPVGQSNKSVSSAQISESVFSAQIEVIRSQKTWQNNAHVSMINLIEDKTLSQAERCKEISALYQQILNKKEEINRLLAKSPGEPSLQEVARLFNIFCDEQFLPAYNMHMPQEALIRAQLTWEEEMHRLLRQLQENTSLPMPAKRGRFAGLYMQVLTKQEEIEGLLAVAPFDPSIQETGKLFNNFCDQYFSPAYNSCMSEEAPTREPAELLRAVGQAEFHEYNESSQTDGSGEGLLAL